MDKTSSTAAIRSFRKGVLSEEGLKNVSKYTKKIMKIKPLGYGNFQKAELVVHPKYGLSTMKIPIELTGKNLPLGNQAYKMKFDLKGNELKRRNKIFNALIYLKNLSKGKKNVQIAQIIGKKGPVHFQKYVKPNAEDIKLQKQILNPMSSKKNYKFNRETEDIFKEFKKKYPEAWDFRRGNVVNNKLVDFEPFAFRRKRKG